MLTCVSAVKTNNLALKKVNAASAELISGCGWVMKLLQFFVDQKRSKVSTDD
jgi:hypothetical protein